MKNLTWQNPEQLFVAQELINKVKSKCCGIKENEKKLAFNLYLRQIIGFDKTLQDGNIRVSLLPKVIPDYKNYPCFVGAVIEGGPVKRLPKNSKFKRGDK